MGRGGKTPVFFSLLAPVCLLYTGLAFLAAVTLMCLLRVSFQSEIVVLMSQSGRTRRQIETWFRLRRGQDRPCQTKKFGEAAWVVQIVTTSRSSPPTAHTQPPGLLPGCVCWQFNCCVYHFTSLRWRFFFYLASFTAGLACLIDVGFLKAFHWAVPNNHVPLSRVFIYLFHLFCVPHRCLGSGTCGNVGDITQCRLEQLF